MNNCKFCRDSKQRGVLHEVKAERASRKSPAVAARTIRKVAGKRTCRTLMETERTGARVVVEDGQQYIKTEVLKHLDQIAKAMLEKAKAGGTTQLRLLWALGKLDEDATADVNRRSPSFSALLMQEIALKQAAKKRAGE